MDSLIKLTLSCPYCRQKIVVGRDTKASLNELLDHLEGTHQDKLREIAKITNINVRVNLERK